MTITRRVLIALASIMPMAFVTTVNAQTIQVLTEPHARSMVILRIALGDLSDDQAVYLELKGPDDANYRELYLFSSDYSAIDGRRFSNPVAGERQVIVPVFVSGVKTWEHGKHTFDSAGLYSIKLTSYHYDAPGVGEKQKLFEKQIEFGEPSNADLEYFDVTRQDVASLVLGVGKERAVALSKLNGDILGLALVAHIVDSTRQKGDPTYGKSEWAEPLYDLAFAVPDSSYAPYVAYYAACSYMWQKKAGFVKRTYGYELPDKRFAELDYYQKAHKALELAVERGDPYIKPFAMCFLAGLKTWAADFGGADELIRRVKSEQHTPKQIADLVDQVQRYTEKLRASTGD